VTQIDGACGQWDEGNNCEGLQQAPSHVRVRNL
jgi:hypothetical protein